MNKDQFNSNQVNLIGKAITCIPPPPKDIFSDLNGDPCPPSDENKDSSNKYLNTIVHHLDRLAQLLHTIDAALLLFDDTSSHSIKDTDSLREGVLIEEIHDSNTIEEEETHPDGASESMSLPLHLLLTISQFSSINTHPNNNINNNNIGKDLTPWTSNETTQASTNLLEILTTKTQSPSKQHTINSAIPYILKHLSPSLLAYETHQQSDAIKLLPFSGPETYQRCLDASKFTWCIHQFNMHQFTEDMLQVLVPILIASLSTDPSPAFQSYLLSSLAHIVSTTEPSLLKPWSQELVLIVRSCVIACDERAWYAASHAAVSLALALDKGNPHQPHVRSLFDALLEEGQRHLHTPTRSSVWLHSVPQLFDAFGIYLVTYFAKLMPLLFEWCTTMRRDVRLPALHALIKAMAVTWPRVPAHADVVWDLLVKVYVDEVIMAGGNNKAVVDALKNGGKIIIKACTTMNSSDGNLFISRIQEERRRVMVDGDGDVGSSAKFFEFIVSST